MTQYVFDTSALLAYIENEEGAADIEALLQKALDDEVVLYISIVTQEPVDSPLTKTIGELKATRTMSFADCCIAGLAKFKEATLVHKDPEYEQIENEIKQLKLPYKLKKKKN